MSADNKSDYEYEYSTTETETYFVDLDFSSVNGIIKSKNSGDRKVLKAPKKLNKDGTNDATPKRKKAQIRKENDADQEVDEDAQVEGDGPIEQDVSSSLPAATSPTAENPEILGDFGENIQILDLHTHNPIVSYRNVIYSCKWTDMIGTNMFFTKHLDTPAHEPEIATEDFDLVGTSRVKLVGHRAIITSKPESSSSRKRTRSQDAAEDDLDNNNNDDDKSSDSSTSSTRTSRPSTSSFQMFVPSGRSLGNIKRTNPRVNIEIKQQASFLERLMTIKSARGDSDTVRTYVDRHILAAEEQQRQQQQSSSEKAAQLRAEIDALNRRVVQGDNEALERLQEIYEMEDEEGVEADELGEKDGGESGGGPGGGSQGDDSMVAAPTST